MYKTIDDLYPHNLISCAHKQNYLWAESKDSKHNEASFSLILMDLLCLQVVQMPTNRNLWFLCSVPFLCYALSESDFHFLYIIPMLLGSRRLIMALTTQRRSKTIQRLPFTYWSGLSWYCKSRKFHCWNIFMVPKMTKLNITYIE